MKKNSSNNSKKQTVRKLEPYPESIELLETLPMSNYNFDQSDSFPPKVSTNFR